MHGRNSSANNLFRFSASLLALEDADADASSPQRHNDSVDNSSKLPVTKSYDYTLKFLLVGDSDVGKEEILNGLNQEEDQQQQQQQTADDTSFCGSPGVNYKSTIILLDGKRIRLQLWYVQKSPTPQTSVKCDLNRPPNLCV